MAIMCRHRRHQLLLRLQQASLAPLDAIRSKSLVNVVPNASKVCTYFCISKVVCLFTKTQVEKLFFFGCWFIVWWFNIVAALQQSDNVTYLQMTDHFYYETQKQMTQCVRCLVTRTTGLSTAGCSTFKARASTSSLQTVKTIPSPFESPMTHAPRDPFHGQKQSPSL